jgi:hypothetical protein
MKWTKVAEQRPDSKDEVLLYDLCVGCIGMGMFKGSDLRFFPGGHTADPDCVSHWILLRSPLSDPSFEGWISTKDKLPKIDERVVVNVGDPKWRIIIGKRKSDGDWTDEPWIDSIPRRQVSHWMPLPDPPQ